MEQYGNKGTFNVEGVLQQNIVNSDYYKELYQRVSTWNEIVDEIYNEVTHAEPWMGGNARGPSTFYCLVYKLFTIKCTEKQIVDLIEHPDSPFIRAAGFMYLRYVGDPKDLFSWYEAYLTDEEEISPAQQGKTVTIGTYIRDLLLDQSYFDTLFPRIPEVAKRQAIKRLGEMGLPTTAVGGGGTGLGGRADPGQSRRPPSVKAALSVNLGQRAPHRADNREQGRGIDPTLNAQRSRKERSPKKSPPPPRANSPPARKSSPPPRSYDRRVDDRRGDDRRGDDRRDKRDRSRERDDRRGNDRREFDRRDRGNDRRDRDRDYDRRDRDRDYERKSRGRDRSRDRSRSRGRDRSRSRGREANDVFRDSASARSDYDSVKKRYG
ncbi:hypothetical protein CYMTET_39426 [Cymbomonas tetramitiformis]|uniref:Pre-mRNA-splicing factor 38 n=1 Tax=Cymbomonas tetramitiformis TaxID=36881 RepID=A0AAE0F492_9CHLO|nr:hypothetical protein CYMTET_39426 [Cymbomonas tetramitiformis]